MPCSVTPRYARRPFGAVAVGRRRCLGRFHRPRLEPMGSHQSTTPLINKKAPEGTFLFIGGEGGIDSLALRAHPSGGLRPSVARQCRARFEPRVGSSTHPHRIIKKAPNGAFPIMWRRGWDYSSLCSSPLRGRRRWAATLSRPPVAASARTQSGFVHTSSPNNKKGPNEGPFLLYGGEGGIRTHGTASCTLDFESSPFDHSGTSPTLKPDFNGRLRRLYT